MKKKMILVAAGLFAIFGLAACGSSSSEKVVTMKGGSITVDDFYTELKAQQTSQSTLQNMIITKVFDEAYGKDVSDDEVNQQFADMEEQYGGKDAFADVLENAGYTEKSYKEALKQQLAVQAGLKDHVELTDADYETAWESFHPEVEAQIIRVEDEDEANSILKDVKDKGDFTAIAKEKSTDASAADGGTITFDSQSTEYPAELTSAAFNLKDGEISDVITAMDSSTYVTYYYIVKMTSNEGKGNDMDVYKDQLEEIATNNKLADSTFTSQVIGEVLSNANVKIKDDTFADVLASYTEAFEATQTSSDAEATDATDSSEAATDATE